MRAPFKVKVKGDTDLTPVPSDISPDSSWDSGESLSQWTEWDEKGEGQRPGHGVLWGPDPEVSATGPSRPGE